MPESLETVTSCAQVEMPSKSLFLHIGLHKTATTHVQHVCADNRAMLQAAGLLYPATGTRLSGHHHIPSMIRDRPRRLHDWFARLYDDPAPAVLVSSENFDLLEASDIAALAESVGGFQVTVLLGLRNQIERLQSCYAEDAKKFLTATFESWLVQALQVRRHVRQRP